jgi:hypothetical protein
MYEIESRVKWLPIKRAQPPRYKNVMIYGYIDGGNHGTDIAFWDQGKDENKELNVWYSYRENIVIAQWYEVEYWCHLPNFCNSITTDRPERSKREDSQECEMRCSEHCGNTMRDK